MPHKFFSLIIIPHNKAKSKTISFSKKAVKIAAAAGIFACIALAVFLIDYFTMNVTRHEYKLVCKENADQGKLIAQYEETIHQLLTSIERFEKYAKKINVMAGLKSPELLEGEPGVGGFSNGQEITASLPDQDLNPSDLQNISQKAKYIEKNLDTLTNFWEDKSLQLAATPSIWPTRGYISSAYTWRDDPFTGKRTFHHGIDIATNQGNSVFATADGVVVQARFGKIGGKTIKIKHLFGFTTVYCHLSRFLVKVGQKVKRGETIGLVGSTGKTLGPHVHYEVHLNGKVQNPYYYLLEE